MSDYEPRGKPGPACKPGDFIIAATHLDHGHIIGQCEGLIQAGATIKWVYDSDASRVSAFREKFPQARPARSLEEILEDSAVQLVVAAAVPCEHGPLGCRVLRSGKDYFTDKTPFTTLEQLDQARRTVRETGRKYAVYFNERIHSECSVHAGHLVVDGAIGRVVQTIGTGPHRLNAKSRAPWFFERGKSGGILCDLGSHQVEQFLYFSGANDAQVKFSSTRNVSHPDFPEWQDFGECLLWGDNGASGYFRVDWLTPDGLSAWGDGRLTILGSSGYIELRKYVDIATGHGTDRLYIVNGRGEHVISCKGKVGFPFFGQLIRDCLERTETAMTQEHVFKAAELSLLAQNASETLKN
jgi:predicted dehydrogenase